MPLSQPTVAAITQYWASFFGRPVAALAQRVDRAALYLLTSAVLSELPPKANILCVGAETGAEILYLAQQFPEWHFTAVESSTAMLDVFRR